MWQKSMLYWLVHIGCASIWCTAGLIRAYVRRSYTHYSCEWFWEAAEQAVTRCTHCHASSCSTSIQDTLPLIDEKGGC